MIIDFEGIVCSQPELFGKILGLFICPDQHDISFIQMIGSNSISKNSVIPFNHIYGRIEAFMSKHSPKFCSVEIITKLIKMMEALTFAVHLQNDEYLFPSLLPKGVFMCVQLLLHNCFIRWHSVPKSLIDTTFTLGRRIFRKNNSMILYFSFSSLQVCKKMFYRTHHCEVESLDLFQRINCQEPISLLKWFSFYDIE